HTYSEPPRGGRRFSAMTAASHRSASSASALPPQLASTPHRAVTPSIDAQKCTSIPAADPLIEGLTAPALGGPARPCVRNRIAPAAALAIPTPPIRSPAIALARAELALAPSRVGARLACTTPTRPRAPPPAKSAPPDAMRTIESVRRGDTGEGGGSSATAASVAFGAPPGEPRTA